MLIGFSKPDHKENARRLSLAGSKPISDAGSNPAWSTIFLSVAQWIEHQPSKLRVIGSSPIGEAKLSLSGGIGRHKGLKIPRLENHDGSNPSLGTILKLTGSNAIETFYNAPRTFLALSRQYFYRGLVKIIEKKPKKRFTFAFYCGIIDSIN